MPAPPITPLPPAPLRTQSPATFTTTAENFVDALPDLVTEINAFGDYLDAYIPPAVGTAGLLDVDTDTTLAANSDSLIPTQKAVKAYVDANAGQSTRLISFFFTTTPTASEVLLLYTACEAITLADDFAGSVGDVGTNPTSSFVLDVQKNGSSVGSITISTGGAFTFATTGGAVSLVSGDQVKIVGPSPADATCANVSITLRGEL